MWLTKKLSDLISQFMYQLSIFHLQIPADGLSALRCLQILDLSGNAVTLPELSALQQLQELHLRYI